MKKNCEDCKHLFNLGNYYPPICKNTSRRKTFPMTLARMQRNDGWLFARLTASCGKEGRFFEAKS